MNYIIRHFLDFAGYWVHLEPQVLEQLIPEKGSGCGYQNRREILPHKFTISYVSFSIN